MKRILFLFAFAFALMVNAQRPLITNWTNTGTDIKFRVLGSGTYTWEGIMKEKGNIVATYNGSGSFSSGLVTITLPTNWLEVKLSITPSNSFRFIYENSGLSDSDIQKFSGISQWGDIKWSNSLSKMFYNLKNLSITATDIPNFSNVTDMSGMFSGCTALTTIPNIGKWDVSKVTNMNSMFSGANNFSDNLSAWNTGNVTDMGSMFSGSGFNGNISAWDTSNVTNMSGMFGYDTSFNQPIGNWNTGKVTDMAIMFSGATAFNQPIGNWNTSAVTSMGSMFSGADVFNQPIGSWNTGNVTRMSYMFKGAKNFNQPLEKWDVSKVSSFNGMFSNATSFNQQLGNWKMYGTASSMLDNTAMNCSNYGLTLKGWAQDPKTGRSFNLGAANLIYGTTGKIYRDQLIANGWTINGDYYDDSCSEATLGTSDVKSIAMKISNPVKDLLTIQTTDRVDHAEIYSMTGQLVKSIKGNEANVSDLPKGVYLLKIITDKGTSTQKIIKE